MAYLRQGRINKNAHHSHAVSLINQNKKPDDFRVHSLIGAIERGNFTHYVRGGMCRATQMFLTPSQVAKRHNLNLATCLFEVDDARVRQAVRKANLQEVSASHYWKGERSRSSFNCW